MFYMTINISKSTHLCSHLKHLVFPSFGSPRRDETCLLLAVDHAPVDLLLSLNDTDHGHQHGGVTTHSDHGPLQHHPQLFGQLIGQTLNLREKKRR